MHSATFLITVLASTTEILVLATQLGWTKDGQFPVILVLFS